MTEPAKKILLIVEDEALIRWPLKQRLEEEGMSVLEAGDGAAALEKINDDGIEGVLLDLRLPDMNGLEILKLLREKHPQCRVWIMTAYGTPEVRDEAEQLGIEEFIDKPFQVEELVQRLLGKLGG